MVLAMPARLSAIDSISPAFEQTRQQLFKPFRLRHWLRLATVCLVTGDFAGGGGWGGGNFSPPSTHERKISLFLTLAAPSWERLRPYLPWILIGVAVLFGVIIVWLYAASVYRFILFDAVLYNHCELARGWRRWQPQGRSYFCFIIVLALAMPMALAVLVGGPIFLAWLGGIFQHPREHLALLIGGGAGLVLVLFAVIVVGAVVGVFAKDFAVPFMALENLGMVDAWRRLLPMLAAEKGAYAGYVLMKIVLAVGTAILFGIITLITLLALMIPLAILAVAVFLIAKAAGVTWGLTTISIVVVLGGGVLMGIFYVVAFVSTPAMVFFQSYTLYFFGSRYPNLGTILFPGLSEAPTPTPYS